MIYAIVENGIVVNVIVANVEFAEVIGAILLDGDFSIGDKYESGTFVEALKIQPISDAERISKLNNKTMNLPNRTRRC